MNKVRNLLRICNLAESGIVPMSKAVRRSVLFSSMVGIGSYKAFTRDVSPSAGIQSFKSIARYSPVIVACESTSLRTANPDKLSVIDEVGSFESSRPSMSFVPKNLRIVFPVLCWSLLVCVWLSAAAGPIMVIYCMVSGMMDALLAFLSIWLLGSVLKFPHIPWLTEAITTGIEAWFRDFSICYEGCFAVKSNAKLVSPSPGASSQKTIYCYHPHGLFSIGAVLLAVELIRRGEKIAFVTSAHMRWFNPLLKMFMDMAGIEIVGASAKEVQAAMKRGERSLILVPGGYEEAVLTQNGFERLFLQERKGFVKYAIRYGYSLTPVYAFGENDLYTCVPVASGLRNWLAKWKIPIVVFYGDSRIPVFPHQDGKGVKIIVGNPLEFSGDERNTAVRAAHALYMDRLIEMYYRHNRDADRPLEIV